MPEPERDIEKTLRAYAKKRREDAGAPAEMHPATRRLLRGEIARVRGKPSAKSSLWTRIFGSSWPQIALRVSVLMLLAATSAFLLLPFISKPKTQLATRRQRDEQLGLNRKLLDQKDADRQSGEKYKSLAEKPADKVSPETPQSASGTINGLAKNDTAKIASPARDIKQENFDRRSLSTGAVPTAAVAAAAPANKQSNVNAFADSAAIQPATPPVAAPAVPSGSLAAADREPSVANLDAAKASANSVTQRFIQANQATKLQINLKSPGQVVLGSFRVEQTGNQLRVIDSDGSIYSGIVGQAEEKEKASNIQTETINISGAAQPTLALRQKKQPAQNEPLNIAGGSGGGANIQSVQKNFFRVSGTNLSLNQPVVFTGSFMQNAQSLSSSKSFAGNASVATNLPAPATSPAPLQLLNSQLQGRAVIGTNQIEINALPVKP